jgi:UrcA family protein
MMKQLVISALAGLALCTSVSAASAQAPGQTTVISTKVRYDDLDLTHAAGARVMLERITSAARRDCYPEPTFREPAQYSDWRHCMATAIDDAVRRLDAPMVTAAYGARQASGVVLAQATSH